MIGVTVVARHLSVRLGLREMLSGHEGIKVVSETDSLDAVPGLQDVTDVLLLAAPFEFAEGATTIEDLLERDGLLGGPALLLLSDEAQDILGLVGTSRVWGILPRGASEEELEAAVRALAEGLVVGAPALLKEAWRRPVVPAMGLPLVTEQLTARETEVLGLMARGLANKQIAAQLGISEHTVKFHLSSVYTKLGANSRTEALTIGTKLGLIVL